MWLEWWADKQLVVGAMTAAIGVAWTTVQAWRGHRISVDTVPDQISVALLLIGGLLLAEGVWSLLG